MEPLLPPAGSALLITSRNKFALPGLKEKDLDVLPLEDAKKLLLEIAGRIGEHAGELAKLCGCLPLALRNAAYALAEMTEPERGRLCGKARRMPGSGSTWWRPPSA